MAIKATTPPPLSFHLSPGHIILIDQIKKIPRAQISGHGRDRLIVKCKETDRAALCIFDVEGLFINFYY